jgi:HD superfamily phosphodiesterase
MTIPAQFANQFIYHFTHFNNLAGILRNGLLSTNAKQRRDVNHLSIASSEIQRRRATMQVTCGPGGVVHDYVPCYFCQRSSMLLAVVNAKNVDQQLLIYYAFPISILSRNDVVFSDAAANTAVPPQFYSDPADLIHLNWGAINSAKWKLSPEKINQQRMAEALVYEKINITDAAYLVVWNDGVAKLVKERYREAGLPEPVIRFETRHYFTKYPMATNQSLVTGPIFRKRTYESVVQRSIAKSGKGTSPKFSSLSRLREALQADLGCLPETAELINLQSSNDMHINDVGTHTLRVVEALKSSPEYLALNEKDKCLTEVAAYLHDIGKGPRSKWPDGVQKPDPDHPLSSAEMLERIMTEELTKIKNRSIRVLTKLVCYHDLVGDIVGKGRDERQLEEIAETEPELDMLIALGLADMTSVSGSWSRYREQLLELRARVAAKLKRAPATEDE